MTNRLLTRRALVPILFAGFLLAGFASPATATQEVEFQPGEVTSARQWEVLDIGFHVETVPQQPFDIDFSADFKNSRGESTKAHGFYNDDGDFVIRWTPQSPGEWTFVTHSTLNELDGLQGAIKVDPAKGDRKGGIVIDPKSPTRFRFRNGDTYFPIAFEADWLFALDAENSSDIPLTRTLVDRIAADGFNQVVMNVFAYDVNWKKDDRLKSEYDYGSPQVFPFGGSNSEPDHSTLNVEYFKRLDRVIDYLDQKGIVSHLMIYVWNKNVNWPEANSADDDRYFDYVAKRYQAYPNLVWDVSKEALGYGHNDVNYISERIERLRKLDECKRLITVHDYGYCRRFTENVDFVSVQLWSSELYGVMRKVCSEMPGKPILNIEHGGYERGPYVVFTGNYTSPEVCLERAYQCVFAGTYPTHYWQGAAWNVIIPDITELEPQDRPRLGYYKHLNALAETYNFDGLIAGQKKSNAGFCLHDDKYLYIYYVPKECDFIGLRLPSEARGKTMTGTWFNPFEGTFGQPVEQEVVQWPAFEKPDGDGFRVLIVEVQPNAND